MRPSYLYHAQVVTDEYEQGAYWYFDVDQQWGKVCACAFTILVRLLKSFIHSLQRKKTDFTFEYIHLEDEPWV